MKTRLPQRRPQATIILHRDDGARRWHGEPGDDDDGRGPTAPVLAAGPARVELGGTAVSFCAMSGRVASIDLADGARARGPGHRAARRALLSCISADGDIPDPAPGDEDVSITIRTDLAHGPLFLLAQVVDPTSDRWLDPARPARALLAIERSAALVALRRDQHEIVSAGTLQAALDDAVTAARTLTGAQLCDALRRPERLNGFVTRFRQSTALLGGIDGGPIVTARREQQSVDHLLAEMVRLDGELTAVRAQAIASPSRRARRGPKDGHPLASAPAHKEVGPSHRGVTIIDGTVDVDAITRQRYGLGPGPALIAPPDGQGRLQIVVPVTDAHQNLPLTWVVGLDLKGRTVGAAPLRRVGAKLLAELETASAPSQIRLTTEPFGIAGGTDLRVAIAATRRARFAMRSSVADGSSSTASRQAAREAIEGLLAVGMLRRARSLRELVTMDDLAEGYGPAARDVVAVLAADPTPMSAWRDRAPIRPLWWWVASDAELGEEPQPAG